MQLTKGQIGALANLIVQNSSKSRNEALEAFKLENQEAWLQEASEYFVTYSAAMALPSFITTLYTISLETMVNKVSNHYCTKFLANNTFQCVSTQDAVMKVELATIDATDLSQLKVALGIE